MEISVRKATKNDLLLLLDLTYALFSHLHTFNPRNNPTFVYNNNGEYVREKLADKNYIYLLAELHGQIVGYAMGKINMQPYLTYKRTKLQELFITEENRHKGIGTTLIEEFTTWSKTKEADCVILDAFVNNKEARKLYKKLNFSPRLIIFEKKISKQ